MQTVEQPRPAELAPTVEASGGDEEALFREAKRRERRRRLAWLGALILVLGAVAAAVAVTRAGSTSGGPASPSAAGASVPGHGTPLALPAKSTVILLVDTSGSMAADDIKPSRIEVAIAAMQDFVSRLPSSTRVGLVAFSTAPSILVDPTLDRHLVLNALSFIEPQGATALGDGLATAINVATTSLERQGISSEPGQLLPAAVVLESDGQQNRGALSPSGAADLAKAAGIRVDGISLGTPSATISSPVGPLGNAFRLPSAPKTVRMISNVTGGESFNATNAASLDAIYRQIASGIG